EMGYRHNGDVRYGRALVKDDAWSQMVALAWKMKLESNASYFDIHDATHLYKVPSTYGLMFNNLIYAGIFVYGGVRYPLNWQEGGHFCEPYITLEEFQSVQENRMRRSFSMVHPRALVSQYLLSNLAYCGICEDAERKSKLIGQNDNRTPDYRYYKC